MASYAPSLPRRGIVAAAARLTRTGTKLVPTVEWQADAWRAYDVTGQGRYVANAVANAISRCPLYIAELDPDTGEIMGPGTDPRLRPFVTSPLGTGNRRRENLRLTALNLFVAGEFYLIGEAGNPKSADAAAKRDRWYIVSGFDFETKKAGQADVYTVTRPQTAGSGKASLVADRDIITRVWTPHPKHADQADSPFRAALPDLNILETIKKREAAELDSRLTGAGIMLWPENVSFGDYDSIQGFTDRLVEVASEVTEDVSHPNSMVPLMVEMNADMIEKVRVINFWSDLSDQLNDLTERKIRSLAQSLDAPIEMTLGSGESNHWTAWLVSEDTITTHYDPLLSRIADALTAVYLHPGLESIPGIEPERYAYAFDTSVLRLKGDTFDNSVQLYDRDAISVEKLRENAGYDEGDAPDKDELATKLATKLILADPTLLGTELAELVGLAPTTPPTVIDAERAPAAPAPEPADEPTDSIGPPDTDTLAPEAPADRPALTASAPGVVGAGLGAFCNAAVMDALRVAGGRLRRKWRKDEDRLTLHTTLPRTPEANQVDNALAGVWDSLPVALASVDGVDPDQLQRALDAYTRELLRRRVPHDPAALAAVISVMGVPV